MPHSPLSANAQRLIRHRAVQHTTLLSFTLHCSTNRAVIRTSHPFANIKQKLSLLFY